MEMAYLGLFQKILDWVLKKIFDPIFDWLSGLLTTVFSWIFNELLSDTLLTVLESVLNWTFGVLKTIFGSLIYGIYSRLLKLIDYMETAFDVFIGLRDVTYTTTEAGGKSVTVTGSLLEVLLQQETINTVFWVITMAGLTLALVFTIYATTKSMIDLDFENKRPVSKVLSAMMKTFIQFFTVPLMTLFFLKLSVIILNGVTSVVTTSQKIGTKTSLGRIIFVITSLNAALPYQLQGKDPVEYNLSNAGVVANLTLGVSEDDPVRYPFYAIEAVNAQDYGNIKVVGNLFDFAKFDYLIGFIAAIFLFFILAVCLLTFVQRIFEVILLYIVSPYFVSTIPLDDGEKFKKWREMFIAKIFTGFGSAIGMRLYMMMCPLIMGGDIKFLVKSSTDASYTVSPEMNYLIKLFFLLGGAWAVYKSGPMLTQILNFQAAQAEGMTQAVAGGAITRSVGAVKAYGQKRHQEKKKKEQEDKANAREAMQQMNRQNMENQNMSGRFTGQSMNSSGMALGTAAAAGAARGGGQNDKSGGNKWEALANAKFAKNGQNKDSARDAMSRHPSVKDASSRSNRWNRSGQSNEMKNQKTSMEKRLVITEHKTIRTQIVNVKMNNVNNGVNMSIQGGNVNIYSGDMKPLYSHYSSAAQNRSKPGTGGRKA